MRFSFMFGLLAYTENPQRPKSYLFVRIFRETNSLRCEHMQGQQILARKKHGHDFVCLCSLLWINSQFIQFDDAPLDIEAQKHNGCLRRVRKNQAVSEPKTKNKFHVHPCSQCVHLFLPGITWCRVRQPKLS